MSKAKVQALEFVSKAMEHGFRVVVASDSVVRITRSFAPGDSDAFVQCDMFAGSVLAYAPLRGGSVGGMVALKSGEFVMNKSGSGSLFMKALKQIVQ